MKRTSGGAVVISDHPCSCFVTGEKRAKALTAEEEAKRFEYTSFENNVKIKVGFSL